jgi:hypothetical protein
VSEGTSDRLAALIEENGWTSETRFFRHNLREHVDPTDQPGIFRLSANPDPSEAIEDIFEGGHTALASDKGPGLAFAEEPDDQWSSPDHVSVSIRLGDVVDQGGLVYPVQSVITASVWYMTLPVGSVEGREVSVTGAPGAKGA